MKKILFVGTYDKTDFLLSLSKLLAYADQRVLLIDATRDRLYEYVVPIVLEGQRTIEEFEGFELARGYRALHELLPDLAETMEYDFLLIDSDDVTTVAEWGAVEREVLVTSFDLYCTRKNVNLIERYFREREEHRFFLKLVYHTDSVIDDSYIEHTLTYLPIMWVDPPIQLPFDEFDLATKIENQHFGRVQMKRLSKAMRNALIQLVERLTDWEARDIKAAYKRAERAK